MGEIINLRTARKRTNRRRKEERAAEARALHGVSKVDRELAGKYRDKARRELDGRRIITLE